MNDPTVWLEAELARREALARAATEGNWRAHRYTWSHDFAASIGTYDETNVIGHGYEGGGVVEWGDAQFIEANDPADVLRRIGADRKLLACLLGERHHVEDDPWYTCAAATEERDGGNCCDDTRRGKACDCGRDARVNRYIRLLAEGYGWTA